VQRYEQRHAHDEKDATHNPGVRSVGNVGKTGVIVVFATASALTNLFIFWKQTCTITIKIRAVMWNMQEKWVINK